MLVVGEGEVVPVPVPVEVAELEVAAAVAGREESFASACYHDIMVNVFLSILVLGPGMIPREWTLSQHVAKTEKINGDRETRVGELLTVYAAERPVTFLQPPEGAFVPATKLTAEHCSKSASVSEPGKHKNKVNRAHLVQNTIRRIRHNPHDALGPSPRRRNLNIRLAKVPKTRLLNGRQQIRPIPRRRLIERRAEEPGRGRMNRSHVDEVTVNVEICEVVFGEVDGEAAAGSGAFEIVVEAYGGGVVEEEVRC